MTSPTEKANCVGWYFESKSIVNVQRNFHTKFNKPPPSRNSILSWHKKFLETGSVLDKPRSGRPSTCDSDVERIREAFTRSPTKSTRQASIELGVARSSIRDVLHKRLHFKPYKMQLVQQLKPSDLTIRFNFAVDMLHRIDVDNDFLQRIIFTDEATFHLSGHVNKHNTRIWGSENPHFIIETARDSPKVNVWCGLMADRVIGPFFFAESTVTKEVYLDMLQLFAIPQISHIPKIFWQQDGAPPHWGKIVRSYLDTQFPQRWIGRDGPLVWPPRSPDLTPLDFFLWGYVKDKVFASKMTDITQLKTRIIEVIENIPQSMLTSTWNEIEYRLDVTRATKGAHIEMW